MLYVAFLYCPIHPEEVQLYDDKTKKPCIGRCGHTICLECVDNHSKCPICNEENSFIERTINWQSLNLVQECRQNVWILLKNWCTGEKFSSGTCSKCSCECRILRICLTCDEKLLIDEKTRRFKWSRFLDWETNLLNITRHVLCSNCALDYHKNHSIIRINEVKFAKEDIQRTTSQVIHELFRDEMEAKTDYCKLQQMRIERTNRFLSNIFRDLDQIEKGECGYFGEQVKMELINRYIMNVDVKMKELFSNGIPSKCECTRVFEKIETLETDENYNSIYWKMAHIGMDRYDFGCPFYSEKQLENRAKLYKIIGEECPIEEKEMIKNERPICEFCYLSGCTKPSKLGVNSQNCMEIYENLWKNEMPPLSKLCIECVSKLNCGWVGPSCRKIKEMGKNENLRKYIDQLCLDQSEETTECLRLDCSLKYPSLWKYAIVCESSRQWKGGFMMEEIEKIILENSELRVKFEEIEFLKREINFRIEEKQEIMEKIQRIDGLIDNFKILWNVHLKTL